MSEAIINEAIIIDMLIRLTALENILINKEVMTKEEYQKEYIKYQVLIAKKILSGAGIKDTDSVIEELKKEVDNL